MSNGLVWWPSISAVGGGLLPHLHSLNLGTIAGATESLRNPANTDLGFTDQWTISLWIRPNSRGPGATFDEIFHIGPGIATNEDRILLRWLFNGGDIRLDMNNTAGTLFKTFEIESVLCFGSWSNIIITWDGSKAPAGGAAGGDLVIYVNGNLHTIFTPTLDNDDSQGSANRRICVGDQITLGADTFPANYHSLAIWNIQLDAANAVAVYANGDGRNFDLRNSLGNYTQSSSLKHWYLLGKELVVAQYGDDFSSEIDLSTTVNIAEADREEKSPRSASSLGSIGFARPTQDESIRTDANVVIGVSNLISAMVWVKPSQLAKIANETIFMVRAVANGNNQFHFREYTTNGVEWLLASSTAVILKQWQLANVLDPDSWTMLAFTSDSSGAADTYAVYVNGVDVSASITEVVPDADGVNTATNRTIVFGGRSQDATLNWSGIMHQAAIWDVELSSTAIASLYNGGDPTTLDLNGTFGSYSSASDLQWWWKFEQDPTDIAHNYATTSPATPTWDYNNNSASKLVQDNPKENDA